MARLPFGVRCVVYSFITFTDLLNKFCKLSKKERGDMIISKVMDQSRFLTIRFNGVGQFRTCLAIDKMPYMFEKGWKIAVKLAT